MISRHVVTIQVRHFMSGRHLLPETLFLLPILAYFLIKTGERLGKGAKYLLFSFYCVSSLLGWVTLSFAVDKIPTAYNLFTTVGLVQYSASYSNESLLQFFVQKAGLVYLPLIVLLVLLILYKRKSFYTAKNRLGKLIYSRRFQILKQKRIWLVIIAISLALLAQIGPYIALVIETTNGNILTFDDLGSWNRFDMEVAHTLTDYVGKDEIVITYADIALSYRLFRVLDLYRGTLNYLTSVLQGCEGDQIVKTLAEKGFAYCLFPGPSHYFYSNFLQLIASSNVLQTLKSSPWLIAVRDFRDIWILYRITDPTKWVPLVVEDFDHSNPNLSVLRSDLNISDQLSIDNSTAFSPPKSMRIEINTMTGSRGFKIDLANPVSLKDNWFISIRAKSNGTHLPVEIMFWESKVRVLRGTIPDAITANWTLFVLGDSYFQNMTSSSQETYSINAVEFYANIPVRSESTVIYIDDITLWKG